MGLNVYFCDVCGVRVTDVDLRSGHGMLRGQDVICATCLDMGHGKDWLASRGVHAPAFALGAAGANGHRPAQSASALLDHARDRAVTVGDPSPTRDDEDTGIASDHRQPAEANELLAEESDVEDAVLEPVLTPVRQSAAKPAAPTRESSSDFAGAAASFAALGTTPPPSDSADDDEDVEAEASAEVDPSLLTPSAAGGQETDEVDSAAALIAAKARGSAVRGKGRHEPMRRSVSSVRAGSTSGNRAVSTKKTSSSIAAAVTKKSSGSTVQAADKSTSSRITKPKSVRAKKAGVGGSMPLPLKVSLITVPLILLLAWLYVGPQFMGHSRQPDVKDMPAQKTWIEKRLAETTRTVNDAVDSKDLGKLKTANEAWLAFNVDFDKFCSAAKQYSKWTDDDCDTYSSRLKIFDLGGRMKVIRDEMVKQMNKAN